MSSFSGFPMLEFPSSNSFEMARREAWPDTNTVFPAITSGIGMERSNVALQMFFTVSLQNHDWDVFFLVTWDFANQEKVPTIPSHEGYPKKAIRFLLWIISKLLKRSAVWPKNWDPQTQGAMLSLQKGSIRSTWGCFILPKGYRLPKTQKNEMIDHAYLYKVCGKSTTWNISSMDTLFPWTLQVVILVWTSWSSYGTCPVTEMTPSWASAVGINQSNISAVALQQHVPSNDIVHGFTPR